MTQNIASPVCLKNQKKLKCIQFQADELIQAVLLKSQNPQAVLLESRLSRPSGLRSPQKSVSLAKEQAHTDWIKRDIRHFDKLNPLGVGTSGAGRSCIWRSMTRIYRLRKIRPDLPQVFNKAGKGLIGPFNHL